MKKAVGILLAVIVCAGTTVDTRQGVTKQVIGTPPGSVYSRPTAINNKGVVVGVTLYLLPDGSAGWASFSWSARTGFDLFQHLPGIEAVPTDINDRGEVVGWMDDHTDFDPSERGFFWSESAGLIDLGRFIPRSINDRSEMAGYCESLSARWPCVGGLGEIPRALETPTDSDGQVFEKGRAAAINDRGEVVGDIVVPGVGHRAAFWSTTGDLTVLPFPPEHDNSGATGINKQGEILGQLISEIGPSLAITWTPSHAIRWIHPQNSAPFGIDASGTVAGAWYDENGGNPRATLVHRDGTSIDLGPGRATGLNDKRQVIGDDDTSAFVIWTIAPQLMK